MPHFSFVPRWQRGFLWFMVLLGLLVSLGAGATPGAGGRDFAVEATGSGKRLALVIGNNGYRQIRKLENAKADAEAMAAALRRVGFEVTLRTDADRDTLKAAVRNFKASISGGDEVVVYYAGHGIERGGQNYLLPVDVAADASTDVLKDDALPLQRVLGDLEEKKARFALAIIDACRNDPMKNKSGRSGGDAGLAPTTAASGQMVIYAAGSGQKALDRLDDSDRDPNGVFTRILLKEMQKPGIPAHQVLFNVNREVVRLAKGVNHQQEPAIYVQPGGGGDFYFIAPGQDRRSVDGPPVRQRMDAEDEAWNAARDSNSVAAIQLYLNRYRNGRYQTAAEILLTRLTPVPQPVVSAPPADPYPAGRSFRDCNDTSCPELVVIPSGSFMMGSPESEAGHYADEGPQHRVNINYRLAAGKYEVTRGQFAAFVQATGHDAGNSCHVWTGSKLENQSGKSWRNPGYGQSDEHPAVCVSWHDVQAYVRWLSQKTGKPYRLLSEAEWEYAARAGTTTKYSFGDDESQLGDHAWYGGNSGSKTHPAGEKRPNAFGLYDMHGNVWEWVQDCWTGNYNGAPADGSTTENNHCTSNMVRGGSWFFDPKHLRTAIRASSPPANRYDGFGFRVARMLTQ